MAALTTGKVVELLLEGAVEYFESQQEILDKVNVITPDMADLQNAGNFIWREVVQQAPVISGWDMSGLATGVIKQTYPALLGTPSNDFVTIRIDDARDPRYFKERGEVSGQKQASTLNSAVATAIKNQGALFYRSNTTSGYTFVATAQAAMNERQLAPDQRYFLLNDRDTLAFANDLAGRQTLQGRPADTWEKGLLGPNIAGFDVYTGSFLPSLAGGANPATTVTGNQSFAPTAGTVNATTGVTTNVDYRTADIAVAASASYNIGDKIQFGAVNAVGLDDKTDTGQLATFSVIAKPSGTSITVFPKPIWVADSGLSTLEKAYGNIATQILNTNAVNRLNIDTSAKSNLFWSKKSVEVMAGEIPDSIIKTWGNVNIVKVKMKNGVTMYMLYSFNTTTMELTWRLFTWYGVTVANPMACGVAIRF